MDDMDRILEDLEAKRQALDEAIAAIKRLRSGGGRDEKPLGAYSGMTIAEAARKFLTMVNRPASTKEIVEALVKGGLQHNAKDPYSSVYAILRQRARDKGDFKQVATDWALAEQAAS